MPPGFLASAFRLWSWLSGSAAQRLGHSSTSTTTNVYGHVTAVADGAVLRTLDRRLPDVLARDKQGAVRLAALPAEVELPEFDIDDMDDLAA